jgi:hypothetical protein
VRNLLYRGLAAIRELPEPALELDARQDPEVMTVSRAQRR